MITGNLFLRITDTEKNNPIFIEMTSKNSNHIIRSTEHKHDR